MPVVFSNTVRVINPSPSPRNSPRSSVTRQNGNNSMNLEGNSRGRKRKTKIKNAKRSKRGSQKKRGRRASKRGGGQRREPVRNEFIKMKGQTAYQALEGAYDEIKFYNVDFNDDEDKTKQNKFDADVEDFAQKLIVVLKIAFKNYKPSKQTIIGNLIPSDPKKDAPIIKDKEDFMSYLVRKIIEAKNKEEATDFKTFIGEGLINQGSLGLYIVDTN
jgi:hypothetical protein